MVTSNVQPYGLGSLGTGRCLWRNGARALAVLLVVVCVVLGSSAASSAAGNANFVGTWGTSGGWTITKQQPSGACTGYSHFGPTYHLIDCSVSGDKYRFTITYGSSYRSYNTGTISGNKVTGSFTDTNGTTEKYTATRTEAGPAPTTSGKTPAPRPTPLASSKLSSIASSLPPPSRAFSSLSSDVVNAVITVGLVLFLTFPANLFNSTFEENYEDIAVWWQKWTGVLFPTPLRRSLARAFSQAKVFVLAKTGLAGRGRAKKLEREKASFILVLLAGSLLSSLLDPRFGLNLRTCVSFVAIVVALFFGVVVSGLVTGTYHRARKHGKVPYRLRPMPVGLVIAAACVLVSRASGFSPGYLYGVICGVVFGRELAVDEEGHVVALDAVLKVVLAIVAWLLWAVLTHNATRVGSFVGTVLAGDFLASLFVAGLVSTVISLFPVRFLPGHKLQRWHNGAWAVTFGLALFVLVQVLLRPGSTSSGPSHAPLVTTVGLFVAFGVGSVLFHQHFARKQRSAREPDDGTGPSSSRPGEGASSTVAAQPPR